MTRHYPFANGTQFLDWEGANCGQCWKSTPSASRCAIESALANAMRGDGSVTERIARRMGYLDHRIHYCWACPEREAVRPARRRKGRPVPDGQGVLLP